MHMKKVHVLMFGVMLAILASGFSASAQELTKEAKVERIIALTKADAMMDQMMSQFKAMAASQMPADMTPEQRAKMQETQGKMIDLVKSFTAKLRPQQVKIYNDIFTDEEINGLLAFYESPAGRAWVDKMPLIMSQMMIAMQGQMKDIQSEIQRITKEAAQP
jgi:hypothetical protein